MRERDWMRGEAARSLLRLLPRVRTELAAAHEADPTAYTHFEARLQRKWPRLFALCALPGRGLAPDQGRQDDHAGMPPPPAQISRRQRS